MQKLSRGFAYVTDEKKKPLVSVQDVTKGGMVQVTLQDGSFFACVEKIQDM